MRARTFSLLLVLLVSTKAGRTSGHEAYRLQVPNGFAADRPSTGISCAQLGHEDCVPGAPRNSFGLAFRAAGYKWTKELCQEDSDGDGLTNGQELGDPCCQWAPGKDDVLRKDGLSHPGDAAETNSAPDSSCKAPDDLPAGPQSVPDQPVPEQPVPEQPVPDQPVPDQPVPAQPVPDQPVPDQPVPDQPAPDQSRKRPRPGGNRPGGGSKRRPRDPSAEASAEPSADGGTEASVEPSAEGSAEGELLPSLEMAPSMSAAEFPEVVPPVADGRSEEPQMSTDMPEDVSGVCFPGCAQVSVKGAGQREMRDLRVGDVVQTGAGIYSRVFMFTHRVSGARFPFVRISVVGGRGEKWAIELTEGHFVYTNGGVVAAREVRVNDSVHLGDGGAGRVARLDRVVRHGLYNPQTGDGKIVVDGVLATAYTEAVPVRMAHPALLPLRVGHACFGWATTVFDNGADWMVRWLARWA